ncbi:hypothetical protein CDAR_548841 [Caerostris darwini]|uniref:Uncharacterized protein n=1 Tax=Caerostris darwini TaxID=1538125 RepID=A0AAV4WKI0_9ARAC|nr:hypothetical protein CDAR_548841 [Caerostris darwini]
MGASPSLLITPRPPRHPDFDKFSDHNNIPKLVRVLVPDVFSNRKLSFDRMCGGGCPRSMDVASPTPPNRKQRKEWRRTVCTYPLPGEMSSEPAQSQHEASAERVERARIPHTHTQVILRHRNRWGG